MSKTAVIVAGIVVVIAIIIVGMLLSKQQKANTPVENTTIINPNPDTTGSTNGGNTNNNGVTNTNNNTVVGTAGVPVISTSSTVYVTETTATINGSINPEGAISTYWFEYGLTSGLGTKTSSQIVGSGFTTISTPGYLTGLTKDSTYSFRLVAQSQFGKVVSSIFTFKTAPGNPALVGGIPTAKTAAAGNVTRTTADLNGSVIPNKTETKYWFEYGKTANLGNTTAMFSAGNGSAKTAALASVSNLESVTTYYFRLNAQNQFGTVNGSILNFKTAGPVAATASSVTTSNASNITANSATLHGTVNPNLSSTKYWFEYSTDRLLGRTLLVSTDPVSVGAGGEVVTSINQAITGLDSGVTYYFRLVAENSINTVQGAIKTFKTK